jgi:hypothetical protein
VTGNPTQLGRYTVEIPHLVNQATRTAGAGHICSRPQTGDTLTAAFTGQATLLALGVLSNLGNRGHYGGHRAVAGATGSFVAERTFFVATGITTGSFEGTISSPGLG